MPMMMARSKIPEVKSPMRHLSRMGEIPNYSEVSVGNYTVEYAQESERVYLRYRGIITMPDNSLYINYSNKPCLIY